MRDVDKDQHGTPMKEIAVRAYEAGDAAATLEIFIRAVLQGALAAYTAEQTNAWLGDDPRAPTWNRDRMLTRTFVCERHGVVVGFADLSTDGYVDRLFTHPSATRQGVASALLDHVLEVARRDRLTELSTHASEVARPVFARAGFTVVHAETVERGSTQLSRYFMQLTLPD